MGEDRRSLADLVRAFETLRPSEDDAAAVAASLGYGWSEGAREKASGDFGPGFDAGFPQSPAPPRRREPKKLPAEMLEATPISVESVATAPWTEPVGDFEPMKSPGEATALPPVLPSLLRERWLRAILIELARRPSGRGRIDLDALLERLIWRPPLTKVPRIRRASTRLGVQILVDQSTSMLPFYDDQEQVIEGFRHLLPAHAVEVVRFVDHPLADEVESDAGGFQRYRPPSEGTAVLLLSNLGLGPLHEPGREARTWVRFARVVKRSGGSVTALVPVPASRWPRRLSRAIGLVEWDHTTRVSDAHRADRGAP